MSEAWSPFVLIICFPSSIFKGTVLGFSNITSSHTSSITDHFCNPGHFYSSCCTKKGSRVRLHCGKCGHQFMDKSQLLLHHCLYLSVSWGSCHSTKLLWYCTETASFFNKQYSSKDYSRVCSTLPSDLTYSEHMKSWKWKRQPPQHRSKHSRELKHVIFSHSSPPIKVLNIFPCCLFVCLFQMSSLHLFVSGCLHFPPVIRRRAALFPLVTMEMRSTCKYLSTLAKAAR